MSVPSGGASWGGPDLQDRRPGKEGADDGRVTENRGVMMVGEIMMKIDGKDDEMESKHCH